MMRAASVCVSPCSAVSSSACFSARLELIQQFHVFEKIQIRLTGKHFRQPFRVQRRGIWGVLVPWEEAVVQLIPDESGEIGAELRFGGS